ncbi:MAG: Sarcosine oxidase, partial [uncultured bacterium]
ATNDVSYGDQHAILALGPNRWYVLSPYQNGKATEAKLRAMESNKTIAITDVSHAWNVIRLNGRHARDVLAKLCSIDLHPSTFKVGSCAQTELRGLYIVLHATNFENFEIFVMRSFLLTIWDWLQDAAAEYRKS